MTNFSKGLVHSVLSWGSFTTNHCAIVLWHGGNQLVALLRCSDKSLQLVSFFGLSDSHLTLDNTTESLWGQVRSGELVGCSSTIITWSELFGGSFGTLSSHYFLLQKEIGIFIKIVSRHMREWQYNLLTDFGVLTFHLIKHYKHQQITWHPKSSQSVKTSYWTWNTFCASILILFLSRLWVSLTNPLRKEWQCCSICLSP